MSLRLTTLTAVALCLASPMINQGSILQEDKQPSSDLGLNWIVGSWIERKNGVETEEYWIAPKGGVMLGLNRTVRGSGKVEFEFLRIAKTSKGISYFAMPGGRAAVEFPLVKNADNRVEFENPKHDFPQRIIYSLGKDGSLNARIEGTINGQARSMEWHWEKSK